MKKILTLLTGIVFVITILVAVGCNHGNTQVTPQEKETPEEETFTESDFAAEILAADSTKVWVSLHDTTIGCKKHLVMQNVTNTGRSKKVIDNLITYVDTGYTVYWMKTDLSEIKKVHQIRIVDSSPWNTLDTCLEAEQILEDKGSYIKFVIPSDADTGTVKYEIIFEDKAKKFWYIDPHLKIPPPQ
jgi:hypothetical protein